MRTRQTGVTIPLILMSLVVTYFAIFPCVSFAAVELLNPLPECKEMALVTPAGQGPGSAIVGVLCKRNKIDYREFPMATSEQLGEFETLIVVLGSSLKGLGAAGISIDNELNRVKELVDGAKAENMFILGVHTEGESRRGGHCERVIDEVVPLVDYLIVRNDGNEDGRFTVFAENTKIPMAFVDETAEVGDLLKEIFKKD